MAALPPPVRDGEGDNAEEDMDNEEEYATNEEYPYEEDEECPTYMLSFPDGGHSPPKYIFTFKLFTNPEQDDDVLQTVEGEVHLEDENSDIDSKTKVGYLEGNLLERYKGMSMNGGFHEMSDCVDDELQSIGWYCCDDRGRLN
eukprot:3213325-Pyramimonas_sp.AAC.1